MFEQSTSLWCVLTDKSTTFVNVVVLMLVLFRKEGSFVRRQISLDVSMSG